MSDEQPKYEWQYSPEKAECPTCKAQPMSETDALIFKLLRELYAELGLLPVDTERD